MAKCVLVIDSVPTNRIRLSALLEAAQYDVISVSAVSDVSGMTRDPDLIVLGLTERPSQIIGDLARLQLPKDVPLLCLDGSLSPLRRLAALRAGAREVLPRIAPDALLRARIRGLIREGDAQRERERRRVTAASFGFAEPATDFQPCAQVVCVGVHDHLPGVLALGGSHASIKFSDCSVEEALRTASARITADAYIIVSGQNYHALDALLPELRDLGHTQQVPLLVLYPPDRPDVATRALALGASDVAADDSSTEELSMRIENVLERKRSRDALRKSDEQSYRLAATDPLTGLYNRRYAEAYLGDLLMGAQESPSPFTMMLADLDHFKSINDRFGHAAGDQVLCDVADRLRNNLRACDLVARYGGEEFLVILPETDEAQAAITAERLRAAVATVPVRGSDGAATTVTASIGVATGTVPEPAAVTRTGTFDLVAARRQPCLAHVFEAADAALYKAKDLGRNRVVFSAS